MSNIFITIIVFRSIEKFHEQYIYILFRVLSAAAAAADNNNNAICRAVLCCAAYSFNCDSTQNYTG